MPSADERPHSTLATCLDFVAILSAATAIVLFLGARHKFMLGSTKVLMPEPLELLVFAAFAAAIRYLVEPTLRILPAIRVDDLRQRLQEERERFMHSPRATPDVKYFACVSVIASLLWFTPHLANIRHVPDAGDPIFSAWRIARFGHQLLNEPARLFDGNIFHPARYSLTYSDPTVLESVIGLPFLAAGADPLIVANVLFLASFPFCALAFFYAGWRLTADARAGCIAGILGGLSTFKIEHYSHLELQFVCFAPLAVIMLMRAIAAPSWRSGAAFGLAVTGQWLASMYLGIMLLVFLAPVALLVAAAWRPMATRQLAIAAITSGTILVIGGAVTAIPFLRSQADRGERSLDAVGHYSAVPSDYVASHRRLVHYREILGRSQPERELFPGSLPFLLGAVAAVPPLSLGVLTLIPATAIAFDGSLGLNGLIYDDLYRYALPFRGMRVPARFAALVQTGLILLSAYGARRVLLLGRTPTQQTLILIGLAAAAVVDVRPKVELEPYFATVPSIYSQVDSRMVLAELPMATVPNFAYMYFSTQHWARLINGQSGYAPADYLELERDMVHFPRSDLVQRLRDRGATHLTVNCRFLPEPQCGTLLEGIDLTANFRRLASARWEGADVHLFAFGN